MKKHLKRILLLLLCLPVSLSAVSCGKALPAFPGETEITEEPTAKWSIYLYLVGSDLESRDLDQLSKLTNTLVGEEAKAEEEAYDKKVADRIKQFTAEVTAEGVDLPNSLYSKAAPKKTSEKNTDVDAIGFGSYSLDLLMNSEIPEGVQFVVQTGGAKRWQSAYVNPNRSQRFLIDCDGTVELTNDVVANMANPDTLEEFLVFCKEYFPAEHEMALFWDHGGAYGGFGIDEIYGTDMLTVREMTKVLSNVQALYSPGHPVFDVIGFDACVMGELEVARLFADYADYYFASPEELSGFGWGYDRIIEALGKEPSMSPEKLGSVVAQAYVDNVQIEGFYGFYPAVFSVYDLNKIEPVYTAYNALIRQVLCRSLQGTDALAEVSAASTRTLAYAFGSMGGFNLIDLGGFVGNLSASYPAEAAAVQKALKECVIGQASTSYFSESSGMSVFFPARMTGTMSLRKFLTYMHEVSDNPDIDALCYYKIAGCLNEQLRGYVEKQGYGKVQNIDYTILDDIPYTDMELSGDGNVVFPLTPEQRALIQEASFGVIYVDDETGDEIYLNERPLASIGKDGKVTTDFDLYWPSLDGNELPVEIISEDAATIRYRVPIVYYDMECYLLFCYDKATAKYTIAGLAQDSDNGTGAADRITAALEEGDEFSVKYQYGNLDSVVQEDVYIDFVYTKKTEIVNKPLSDGFYLEYLHFDDLRSDMYYSPAVVMEVKNGAVVDQYIDPEINGELFGGND